MREQTRAFIAVPVPSSIGHRLDPPRSEIAEAFPSLRWSPGAAFHLTLAFLGDVPNADLDVLCRAVASIVAPFDAFEIQIAGLGAFPSARGPRVLWAGAHDVPAGALADLQTAIVRAVTEAGHPPTDSRFHPHITLGRFRSGHGRGHRIDLSRWIERRREGSFGAFRAEEVVMYSSALGPNGPTYVPLARAQLKSS